MTPLTADAAYRMIGLAIKCLHKAQGLIGAYQDNPEERVEVQLALELEQAIYDIHHALIDACPGHHLALASIQVVNADPGLRDLAGRPNPFDPYTGTITFLPGSVRVVRPKESQGG